LFSAKKTAEGLKAKDSPKLKSLLTYGRVVSMGKVISKAYSGCLEQYLS